VLNPRNSDSKALEEQILNTGKCLKLLYPIPNTTGISTRGYVEHKNHSNFMMNPNKKVEPRCNRSGERPFQKPRAKTKEETPLP